MPTRLFARQLEQKKQYPEDVYFPVLERKTELQLVPQTYCEAAKETVQVKVNADGVVVSCSLAHCGCDIFKGKIAPHDKQCLIGQHNGGC